MTWGEKFKAIFAAKYKDLESEMGYYTHENLKKELENISWEWLVTIHTEIQRMDVVMRDIRLKCTHPKEQVRNYHNLEVCNQCKCSRVLNECEESMFNTWSEWSC